MAGRFVTFVARQAGAGPVTASLMEFHADQLRVRMNLSAFTQARMVTKIELRAGVAGPYLGVQYSLDGSSWDWLDGSSGPKALIDNTQTSGTMSYSSLVTIVEAARTDVYLRLVTGDGNGSTNPEVFLAGLELR